MTRIKICGLTRITDADWANELKPDYVGFVFAQSRRRVTAETAARIAEKIDRAVKRVGVFVNPSMDEIKELLEICPLDILQLHGEESRRFAWKRGCRSGRHSGCGTRRCLRNWTPTGWTRMCWTDGSRIATEAPRPLFRGNGRLNTISRIRRWYWPGDLPPECGRGRAKGKTLGGGCEQRRGDIRGQEYRPNRGVYGKGETV